MGTCPVRGARTGSDTGPEAPHKLLWVDKALPNKARGTLVTGDEAAHRSPAAAAPEARKTKAKTKKQPSSRSQGKRSFLCDLPSSLAQPLPSAEAKWAAALHEALVTAPPPAPLFSPLWVLLILLVCPSRPVLGNYHNVGVVSSVFRLQARQVCRWWHASGCGHFPETL